MASKIYLLATAGFVASMTMMHGAHAAGPGPVTVVTYIDAVPDVFVKGNEEKARALLKQMNADTQNESGLVSFTILRETGRPNHFTILEIWKSQAAFNAHLSSAHTREFRNELQPLIGSPYDTLVTASVD